MSQVEYPAAVCDKAGEPGHELHDSEFHCGPKDFHVVANQQLGSVSQYNPQERHWKPKGKGKGQGAKGGGGKGGGKKRQRSEAGT